MKSTDHRKKSQHNRNGRSRYEKGRQHHQKFPPKKLIKGKRGSTTHAPDVSVMTLADVWPDRNTS